MSDRPTDTFDDDLEAALRDLGAHLDLGPGDTAPGRALLVTSVLQRLAEGGAPAGTGALAAVDPVGDPVGAGRSVAARHADPVGTNRRRLIAAAAAIVVVIVAGLLAIAPTREAIARWAGIGGVRITSDDGPLPEGGDPAPGAPTTGHDPGRPGSVDLEALAPSLPFALRTVDPAVAGELRAAVVDPSVAPGLIELRYDRFTLVELGSRPDAAPVLAKVLGPGTTITAVTVAGRPGYWIGGDPHQVATVDPDGDVRLDSVRRAGDVLLWEDGGVTYRIEGAESLEAAQAAAASLR